MDYAVAVEDQVVHRADMDGDRLDVRVRSITYEAENIQAYEVVLPDGNDLPTFTAGAHIDLHLNGGVVRQYSLCNNPKERHRYLFAVQREENGRGGSKAVFEQVRVGNILTISRPRNNFPLCEDAHFHLLLAGGIGITPLMAMIHRLCDINADFSLHYCTRTPDRTAFREKLVPLVTEARAFLHHDQGDPERGLDLTALLCSYQAGTHLYCCGPSGFIKAVRRGTAHWPAGSLHFELFSPPIPTELCSNGESSALAADRNVTRNDEFEVKLMRSGISLRVPREKSIVEVMRENGIDVETSCETGLCGTCRTHYLDGIPDHRDYVLSDEEQRHEVLICCARAKSQYLVLDR